MTPERNRAETRLAVLDASELRQLVTDAVAEALRSSGAGADAWVDAKTGPLEPRAFRRLAREGAFPTFRAGKRLVAKLSDVNAWIQSRPRQVSETRSSDPVARAIADGRLRVVGGKR